MIFSLLRLFATPRVRWIALSTLWIVSVLTVWRWPQNASLEIRGVSKYWASDNSSKFATCGMPSRVVLDPIVIEFWDLHESMDVPRPTVTLPDGWSVPNAVRFSGNGQFAAIFDIPIGRVVLFDFVKEKAFQRQVVSIRPWDDLLVCNDGQLLGIHQGEVWNAEEGALLTKSLFPEVWQRMSPAHLVSLFVVNNNKETIAVNVRNQTKWELAFNALEKDVYAVAPSGDCLAIWDAQRGICIYALNQKGCTEIRFADECCALDISPHGKFIAVWIKHDDGKNMIVSLLNRLLNLGEPEAMECQIMEVPTQSVIGKVRGQYLGNTEYPVFTGDSSAVFVFDPSTAVLAIWKISCFGNVAFVRESLLAALFFGTLLLFACKIFHVLRVFERPHA